MGVGDNNAVYGPDARFTHKPVSFYVHAVANSQADVEQFEFTPPYNFEIVGFEVYAGSVTATASLDLKIATVSCLSAALTPVAAASAKATINSDGTEYGDADDAVTVHATTNGSGAIGTMNGQIWIRRKAADVS